MRLLSVVGAGLMISVAGWGGPLVLPGCTANPGNVSLYYGYSVGSSIAICAQNNLPLNPISLHIGGGSTYLDTYLSLGTIKASVAGQSSGSGSAGASGTLETADVLSMTGPAGILQMQVSVNFGLSTTTYASSSLDWVFGLTSGSNYAEVSASGHCTQYDPLSSVPMGCNVGYEDQGAAQVDLPGANLRNVSFARSFLLQIPYAANGSVRLNNSLDLSCGTDSFPSNALENCAVDASHSFYVGSAQLFQLDGVTPQSGSILSVSGYDYTAPIGGGTSGVPEPGSAGLIGLGLAAVARRWRGVRNRTGSAKAGLRGGL